MIFAARNCAIGASGRITCTRIIRRGSPVVTRDGVAASVRNVWGGQTWCPSIRLFNFRLNLSCRPNLSNLQNISHIGPIQHWTKVPGPRPRIIWSGALSPSDTEFFERHHRALSYQRVDSPAFASRSSRLLTQFAARWKMVKPTALRPLANV